MEDIEVTKLRKENEALKSKIDTLKKVVLILIDFANNEKEETGNEFWNKYGEDIQRGFRT